MMAIIYKIFLLLSVTYIAYSLETPIIGILSQETYLVDRYFPGEEHASYIAASYVKYLESAGARVIPIWIGQNETYYRRVVQYTNGILFPGGGTYFNESGGYGEAAKELYRLAVELNDKGVYYPIWGTCLGMQVLGYAAVGKDIRKEDCPLKNKAVPLDFAEGFERSKLFSRAPQDIVNLLKSSNVTFNYHMYCLTKEILEENSISSDWTILSTNKDEKGGEFISTFESKSYPFYGIQFHPEKNQFEFENKKIPHNAKAVEVSQYFANFFIGECRKNSNSFPKADIENKSLIYNYNPRYTGGSYEQIYVFDEKDFKESQLL